MEHPPLARPDRKGSLSRRGGWLLAAALILIGGVMLLAWNWGTLRARAQVGVGHGARVTCSCRYVEHRSMDSCAQDKEPGMWAVRLTDDPQARAVEAQVPLMASARARYRPGWGCLFDPTG